MMETSEFIQRFETIFPNTKPRRLVRAPGRVNLIGEHVDYHDGFVLPIAMRRALTVVAGDAADGAIEVYSSAFDETVRFPVDDPGAPEGKGWSNYVRGVAEMLRRDGLSLCPAKLLIESDVPLGGGVSSSAALEVGVALAMLASAGQSLDSVKLALLARQAEHEYAHSPCGIMDQFICVLGQKDHALLLDCRSQSYEQLPFLLDDTVLAVMNTQVKHDIGASEYPVRQKQGRAGLDVLKTVEPDLVSLRDVTPTQLERCKDQMEPVIYRRCRHVISEIERTQQAAEALQAGDLEVFGQLMTASHASLRDDYEVSCSELDALVEIAVGIEGCYGARMTGGGFGGCAIALIRQSAYDTLLAAIRQRYDGRFDKPAIVYTTGAADGASVYTL